jgi:hypothetical protein
VLEKIEKTVKGVAREQRIPMLVLYALFHFSVRKEHHRPDAQAVLDYFQEDFDHLAIENVALLTYLDEPVPWSVGDLEVAYKAYAKRRHRDNALRLPAALDTGILLRIAEAYRAAGDLPAARNCIRAAIEEMPGFRELRRSRVAGRC